MKSVLKMINIKAACSGFLGVVFAWYFGQFCCFLLLRRTTGEWYNFLIPALFGRPNFWFLSFEVIITLVLVYFLDRFKKQHYIYILLFIKAFLHFYLMYVSTLTLRSASWLVLPLVLFSEMICNGVLLYSSWFAISSDVTFTKKMLMYTAGVSLLAVFIDCFVISACIITLF